MVSHVETCSSSLLFVQSSGFEGNVYQVQRQWKPMVAILIVNHGMSIPGKLVFCQYNFAFKDSIITYQSKLFWNVAKLMLNLLFSMCMEW